MLDFRSISNTALTDEINLKRARSTEFARFLAVYFGNVWFRDTWKKRIAVVDDSDHCFWFIKNKKRIGGVVFETNSFMSLFTIPPFNDEYLILEVQSNFLINNSPKDANINAYGVLPSQAEHLSKLGFIPQKTRRCMIRPTELFEDIQWDHKLKIDRPNIEHINGISKLFYENYDNLGFDGLNTLEEQIKSVSRYFRNNSNEKILNDASSIILDTNNEVIAACLISSWEGIPLVYDTAVSSNYRRSGIATKMLKHSLTTLKESYDFMRLFVYCGNPAESVYYKLGFKAGTKMTDFCFFKGS